MTQTLDFWREIYDDEREITRRQAGQFGRIEAWVAAGLRTDPDNEALLEIHRILTEDKVA